MGSKSKAKGDAGTPAWMATFADLMSLLLTFFILLLSFAEMDIVKFKDAMGSINAAFGVTQGGPGMFSPSTTPVIMNTQSQSSSAAPADIQARDEAISEEIKSLIEEQELDEDVEVEATKRGVIMRIRGRMFFNAGTADLKSGSQPLLEKISSIMKRFPKKIAIEGHTDNIPISNNKFSNNWELSTARSYAALKYLQDYGDIDVKRIHIAGFGDTHPLTSNDTPEGRAKNRRVEFVFYEN